MNDTNDTDKSLDIQKQAQRRIVLIMVEADTPAEVVEAVRRFADRIERGGTFEDAGVWEKAAVRACDVDGTWSGEVGFAGRYYGVGYDGDDAGSPVALFASSDDAYAYAAGGVWEDEETRPSKDGIVTRCDVFGLMWNSFDDDPIADDQTAAS